MTGGDCRRSAVAGVLLGSLLLACHPVREVPVRLVDWPSAPAPPAAEAEFPAWTFAMSVWPFDILEPDATDASIASRLDVAVDQGADTVLFYIESEQMYASFVDDGGFATVLDRVAVLVAEAGTRDLRTIVYLNGLEVMTAGAFDGSCNPTGVPTMATEHPDWLQWDLDGTPLVYACQNRDWLEPDWEDAWLSPFSGYRAFFQDRITALGGAGVDGVYIDATFLPGFQAGNMERWGSTDPAFGAAFTAATGHDLPSTVDFGSAAFRAFLTFRHDAVADYLGALATTARAAGMVPFWESSTVDTDESTLLANDTAVTGRAGLGMSPEIEPEGDWTAAFRMGKAARELNGGRPMIYLGWPRSRGDAEMEYAIALAHSGTYYPTADIDVPDHAFGLQNDLADVFARRIPYGGDLALVYSIRNKDFTWNEGDAFTAWSDAAAAVIEAHLPFRMQALEYLEEDGLTGFDFAVLPGLSAVSDGEIAALSGLSIVPWGDPPGTRDEDWAARSVPAAFGSPVTVDDLRAPLPFYFSLPSDAMVEYYQDRDGAPQMYLFVVSPSGRGKLRVRAAPAESLDVTAWHLGGERTLGSGENVEIRIETALTVLTVARR